MRRTHLIIYLFLLLVSGSILAQDDATYFPEIRGETVPEAEARLNLAGYHLDPVILATNQGTNTIIPGTVDDYTINNNQTIVRVTVLREYNVELIWDNTDFFSGRAGLDMIATDELFTLVNQSDESLALDNLEIGGFSGAQWLSPLPAGQCTQIWANALRPPVEITECNPNRIREGNISNIDTIPDQFWKINDSFDIFQNGVYRGTCAVADGRCQLWLSPLAIAEDITPYVYLIYDDSELLIYNSSNTQWMDLAHLYVNDEITALSASWNWDESLALGEDGLAERLAPGQCARFNHDANTEAIEDCTILVQQNTDAEDVFWTSDFTLRDTLNGERILTCPAGSGQRTICILGRDTSG